ncbi:unnamed protein product [Clonostachys rosea]|uniref:Uncharacterized protein n=1 Tax=Bionectria ochroleuca TaxID=29856 RepID=A0ABY6UHJ8_BIOOC|nr:unnamed protein product [Clonostachys rosea]
MEDRVQPWKKWYTPMSELVNDAALTVLPVFLAGNVSGGGEKGSGGGGQSGSGGGSKDNSGAVLVNVESQRSQKQVKDRHISHCNMMIYDHFKIMIE